MQITTSENARIVLRDYLPDDVDVMKYWIQPGHEWAKLDAPYYDHHPPSDEEFEKRRERLRQNHADNNWPEPRRQAAIALPDNNVMIGMVSWYWMSEETNWPAVGIVIYDPAHWGQGLGYEALGLWCDYLFNCDLEFARLDLRTWSGNMGMMKLAEKLGFLEEARFRKARVVQGEFYDGMGYGVLREEWQRRYPQGFGAYLANYQ